MNHANGFRNIMKTKLLITLLLLPALVHAHPGHAGHEGDIGWGLAHPFTGLDHLLAALVVGLWAGLRKGASRFLPLVIFPASAALGMIGGFKTGTFTGLETVLAATVFVLGFTLSGKLRFSAPVACGVTAACAFVHGWAHGAEAPATGSAMALFGIVLGTAVICSVGLGAASLLRTRHTLFVRGIGAATAIIAAAMLVRSF